ncbi:MULTISPECIES: hypothetical protein [Streptomyces]|uniref:DUF8175 domain-containing protein n=1 Tax=Streptomyces lienomycini TaxID=284035 RepID=A0ABV9X9T5_9ACTN|nr:hypothetical protein [Streptomyces sp. NBC_00334]
MSAVFVTLTFLVGGVAALTTIEDEPAGTAADSGPDASELRSGERPRGCRTDDSGGSVPKNPPTGITWHMVGLVRVPVSAEAGPTRMDEELWWCFAHTPLGAVLAAHTITSEISEKHWRTVLDRQIVAGRGRDVFEFMREIEPDTVRGSAGESVAKAAGFSVTSYSDSAAEVELLMRTSSGYTASTFSMRWNGGDWKVLPSPNGALHSEASPVANPRGYVLWKG